MTFTTPNNDLREPEDSFQHFWSAVAQHGWVLGNRGLNQITGQVNHHDRLSDVHSDITGEHYTRDFPNVNYLPAPPVVPVGQHRRRRRRRSDRRIRTVIQIRDDVSLLTGTHALKFGGELQLPAPTWAS